MGARGKAMFLFYTLYMWAVIVAAVLFFGSLAALFLPLCRRVFVYRLIVVTWARTIVGLSGVSLKVLGLDRVDPARPYVFVSNHQSYFDVICLIATLPANMRFVAKKELLYIPLFGQVMWGLGHIVVDRSRRSKAVSEMKKAARKIGGGISILVFPEGARSPDHKLLPFKKGGFNLAMEAGVPVVPVSVSGTRPMMPKGGFTFRKSDVTVAVGEPIEMGRYGTRDRDRLMADAMEAIIAGFPEGSAEALANKDQANKARANKSRASGDKA